ncbi:DUF1353 domain-containing protein [Massilia sp. TS11]|uniref:DUF1353 domain-containing protein n=1 Tax=Massilia sp. TS11 TaxID=2908003 RepID=UPI001EDB80B0|nr:DUF1353 domain-containing protein [Massilia sp. TS11]MCG2584002.1 DUF1353 domain-containing protein [Massilia sp. TS11]
MEVGTFSSDPQTEWITGDGRDTQMRLLAPFSYTDPAGGEWLAPAGSVIDGASIPRTLWSAVGSPYTGRYRRASIVHDVACCDLRVARSEADAMFYQACLAGGCTPAEAKLLYAGVRVGAWLDQYGPLFADLQAAPGPRLPGDHSAQELAVRARFTLIAADLQETGDSVAEVQATVDRHLPP